MSTSLHFSSCPCLLVSFSVVLIIRLYRQIHNVFVVKQIFFHTHEADVGAASVWMKPHYRIDTPDSWANDTTGGSLPLAFLLAAWTSTSVDIGFSIGVCDLLLIKTDNAKLWEPIYKPAALSPRSISSVKYFGCISWVHRDGTEWDGRQRAPWSWSNGRSVSTATKVKFLNCFGSQPRLRFH